MKKTLLLSAILALPACAVDPALAQSTAQTVKQSVPSEIGDTQRFERWKADFINEAIAKGYDTDLVRRVIGPATRNEKVVSRNETQPEFTRTFWAYIDSAASETRVINGQSKMGYETATLDAIEARYGVDKYLLTAIWGLESAYGEIQGSFDIVSAMVTLAWDGRRQSFGRQQLYAILDMLGTGSVRADQLKGSWAGGMGMPQFIPTTFRDYAVDFDGNGNIDIWTDTGDALGSAAHYLSRRGWETGEPIVMEVKLAPDFNYELTDGRKASVSTWSGRGVKTMSGLPFLPALMAKEVKVLAPAGDKGPAFITFKNFEVVKAYNNSTSYALGITALSMALKGNRMHIRDWPRTDKALSFENKKMMQEALTTLGYDTGGVDGLIGPNSRRAIRAWQKARGLTPDGYINLETFKVMAFEAGLDPNTPRD